ncbi:TPM domain-containing protein [Ureibacillus endophyticus]|uniref:TPM domain-containing protein n=1 Tax=Ureibacillus endophyticus TaxID=1978490 RepID=A0A494Z2F1_9BACL|nr:TPM domain-containing protein [Lysinibacillus endophyticus]RKQ16664.1 TPM domain-containing protein [Lysinibacillus endophyticus]
MLKKWMFTFVLLLVLPLSVVAQDIPERPTTAGFVFDYQNVIDDAVEAEINEIAKRLQEEGKMELMIVTVPTIGELEPYEYGMKFFREWGIGDAEKDNGMLIYITTDMGEGNNVVRISTGYGMEGSYPDSETQRLIQTYMKESLKSGDYTSAFANVVEAIRVKEDIDYTWENDGAVIEEMSENTEESEETLFEKITGIFFTIIGILFFLIMAGVALLIAYVVLEGIFRRLQGLFYWIFEAIFRKDIRSKGYIKYLENKKQEQKKNKARKASGLYYDNHYDSSNSSDSYSYGSGDSGGGGSDDRF